MIEVLSAILLAILIVLAAQMNILVLVQTNLKRRELEQKVAENNHYITPTSSIQEWQWESPEE